MLSVGKLRILLLLFFSVAEGDFLLVIILGFFLFQVFFIAQ